MALQSSSTTIQTGAALVAFALLAVVVAYPPPATGVPPLFGVGNLFLPLALAVLALAAAAVGGFLLAPAVEERVEPLPVVAPRLLGSLAALGTVGLYLVTVAGFL